MKTYTLSSLTLGVVALIFASGCGRQENSGSTSTATPAPAEASAPARPAPAEGRAIEITGNDAMKFSVTEIRATPGEALAVTLKNVGTMPKFSMGHNWVLIAANVNVEGFATDAAQAVKTDYVPAVKPKRVLAATKLLGPGESDTVRFYAPDKPGRYPFICSFPGHFQVGMKGELIVE